MIINQVVMIVNYIVMIIRFNPDLSLDFVASSLSCCETGTRTVLRRSGFAKAQQDFDVEA